MSLKLEGTKTAPACLRAVSELTARLHQEGVLYCHWKSNEHLAEGTLGITDLDVLFDRGDAVRLGRILAESGYKRFAATPGKAYPGVEDYLALDADTGKLIHLHLHYELTAGEAHLKGFRLPWEGLLLSTRRHEEACDIYIADPNVELLLLLVRSVLKLRWRDRALGLLGRACFRGGDMLEFRWLKPRVELERLFAIGAALLGSKAAGALADIVRSDEPSLARLLALRRAAWPRLSLYRTYGPVGARIRRWVREALWLRAGAGKRYGFPPASPLSRVCPRGGLFIACLGPDGSGKSTLSKSIVAWLSWKVDTRAVYFGSGDGPSSILRWPLKLALRAFQSVGLLRPPSGGGAAIPAARPAGGHQSRSDLAALPAPSWNAPAHDAQVFTAGLPIEPADPALTRGETRSTPAVPSPALAPGRSGSRLRAWLRPVWALVLALEKRRTLRKAWRGRHKGMVMVADRYPQNQVMGFNDGPLLSGWRDARSRWRRALGRFEGSPYERAEAYPPDLVIKLHVSPEVARARKPEMELDEIRRRQHAVTSLRYPGATIVVDISADRPWEEVLLEAKKCIWERL